MSLQSLFYSIDFLIHKIFINSVPTYCRSIFFYIFCFIENPNDVAVHNLVNNEEERENIEPVTAEQQVILYQCSKCSQTFSSTKKLNAHCKTHEPREYSCEICLKSFKLKSTLTNHMKFHDDKERARRFTCDICMSNFSHPSNLKRHIKSGK